MEEHNTELDFIQSPSQVLHLILQSHTTIPIATTMITMARTRGAMVGAGGAAVTVKEKVVLRVSPSPTPVMVIV